MHDERVHCDSVCNLSGLSAAGTAIYPELDEGPGIAAHWLNDIAQALSRTRVAHAKYLLLQFGELIAHLGGFFKLQIARGIEHRFLQ